MQPLRMVERKGFLKVLKAAAPHYTVPSRFTFKRYINEKFDSTKVILKEQIKNKNCTITTDAWTDIQMRSYLSATIHFCEDENMFSGNLGLILLDEKHTSEYLAFKLEGLCGDWDINFENITAVVTDNANNIVRAISLAFGQKKHIACFAHTLNLVAQKAVENCIDVQKLIDPVKRIVKWFKHSVVASDELRKLTDKKLIQSVPTRWNSTYEMVQRFLELRPHVNMIINNYSSAPCMVTASQVEDITEVMDLLQPLDNATTEICGEKYLTSSLAIPIVHIINKKLSKIVPKKETSIQLKTAILEEMSKRFEDIETKTLLSVATLLDPRFKTMYFEDQQELKNTLRFINKVLQTNEITNTSSTTSSDSDISTKDSSLFSEHNRTIQKKWRISGQSTMDDVTCDNHSELSLYIRAPAEKIQQNPLQFWHEMASTYPQLSNVAKTYLTTVATSVPSERLFSKAGRIISESRNRLKGTFASKLIFLNGLPDKIWEM